MPKKPLTKQSLLEMVLENNERNAKIVTWLVLEVAKDDYQKIAISNSIGKALRKQREELMNRLSDLL